MLARAHAQSPNALVASAYLGTSDVFDRAIASWALGYARVVDADIAEAREAFADELAD